MEAFVKKKKKELAACREIRRYFKSFLTFFLKKNFRGAGVWLSDRALAYHLCMVWASIPAPCQTKSG
jgi:hypothetical protein